MERTEAPQVGPRRISEGQAISLDEELWESITPEVGVVLEFHLDTSSLITNGDDAWAAILVEAVEADGMKGWKINGRFLGCESKELAVEVGRLVSGPGLHLCAGTPCAYGDSEGRAHVTQVRFWQPANFQAGYLVKGAKRALQEAREPPAPADRGTGPEAPPAAKPKTPRVTRPKPAPKDKKPKDTSRKPPARRKPVKNPVIEVGSDGESADPFREEEAEERGIDRGALREMLRRTRVRMQTGAGVGRARPEEDEALSGGAEPKKSRHAVAENRLVAGTGLNPWRPTPLQLADQVGSRDGGMDSSLRKMARSKDLNRQLLAAAAQRRGDKKGRKKEKKEDKGFRKVIKLLTRKERKKKKQKRRKKEARSRVKREFGSEDSGGSSGGGSSSSSDSEESEVKSSDSELDFEPPLRKKALTAPGSVMEMLIKHAQDQLDRGAILEGESQGPGVTSGIKVSTYFALMVRPYYPQGNPLLRELYALGQSIDLLRAGRLAETADALASRFIAVHTALSEGNWSTAAQLELYPLEAVSSATTSTMLQAQKHKRLIQKSQGYHPPGKNYWGLGRGKGKWNQQWNSEEKGKGGKGKEKGHKGKGKKGSWGQEDRNPWKENKEDPGKEKKGG